MKRFILLLLIALIYSCLPDKMTKKAQVRCFAPIALSFKAYLKGIKKPITTTSPEGIITESVDLGLFQTDSMCYRVIRKFTLIPAIDGLDAKGNSKLLLLADNGDTLLFDLEMPHELPINIYRNNFVIETEEGAYLGQRA